MFKDTDIRVAAETATRQTSIRALRLRVTF